MWNYSISGGTISATETSAAAIQTAISHVSGWSSINGTNAVAINSPTAGAAEVVVTGATNSVHPRGYADTGVFLYNVGTGAATLATSSLLGNLLLYDPWTTVSESNGHQQCINNAGQLVGYTGVQSTGTWHASLWQPDANGDGGGAIVDLNSLYAGILPSNVTLNCASAIDNSGDIAGICTVGGNTMQSFVIYNDLPGDANLDGRVDINDLTIVLANYGRTGSAWSQGEFTGSGTVDINDLTIVLANYGQTAGAAGALTAVPEPSGVVLIVIGLVGLLWSAWRRRVR